jgi:hypothetical protein
MHPVGQHTSRLIFQALTFQSPARVFPGNDASVQASDKFRHRPSHLVAHERDGHRVGAHAVACGAAGGMGGSQEGGGDTMSGALLSLGAALVAVAAAQAAPVSVGELLSDPDRFRGQPVAVIGTMSKFREYITHTGTHHFTFYFSDGTQSVFVIAFAKPPCQSGAATVEGTFEQVKWRAKVNYSYEEITAWKRDLLPRPRTEDEVNVNAADMSEEPAGIGSSAIPEGGRHEALPLPSGRRGCGSRRGGLGRALARFRCPPSRSYRRAARPGRAARGA